MSVKPYWKTPSHIIAVAMLIATHIGALIAFFYVIGTGINAKSSGASWEPTQEQVSIVLTLGILAAVALVYFFADLGLYIAQKRRLAADNDLETMNPPIRGERVENTIEEKPAEIHENTAKTGVLFTISPQKPKISYGTIMALYLRSILGMVIVLGVLLLGVIAMVIVRRFFKAEIYIMVLLYCCLGMAVLAFVFVLMMPALMVHKFKTGPDWGVDFYDDRVEVFYVTQGNTRIAARYDSMKIFLEKKDAFAISFLSAGRKMMLFIPRVPELTPEWENFLKEKVSQGKE